MTFSNSNAKRKITERISVCNNDFLTNSGGDLTPNGLKYLDGLNCGIPTRTTPTLTPTTLRNIEQTFIELQGGGCGAGVGGGGAESGGTQLLVGGTNGSPTPSSSAHEAGFMPPIIHPTTTTTASLSSSSQGSGGSIYMNLVDTKSWQGGTTVVSDAPTNPDMLRNITLSSVNTPPVNQPSSTRKNVGGRRPNRDHSISAEEEEKRQQRRERNKLAAARCRKRRLDHTNELLEETEGLESKKMSLQSEIQQLQQEKEELEYLLETHKPVCRRLLLDPADSRSGSPVDVKPLLLDEDENKIPPNVRLGQQQIVAVRHQQQELSARHSQQQEMYVRHSQQQELGNSIRQHSAGTVRQEMGAVRQGMAVVRQEMPAPQHPIPSSAGSRPRPTSLPVVPAFSATRQKEAVPISTPTSGVHFNFDSLMEGGTGLTPVNAPLAPTSLTHGGTRLTPLAPLAQNQSALTSLAQGGGSGTSVVAPLAPTCSTQQQQSSRDQLVTPVVGVNGGKELVSL